MSWTRKALFLLIGLGMPLLAGLLALEVIFGNWLKNDQWMPTRQLNIVRDTKIHYKFDSSHGPQIPAANYSRDIYGLRSGCSDSKDIDVVTIGGSTTDQRYVSDGETWQDILQRKLTQKLGRQVCVSNAGVDGHSTFGHLASFEKWFPLIPGFKPKLFIFYVGINDASFRLTPNPGFDTDTRRDESGFRSFIRNNSAFYQLLISARDAWRGIFNQSAYAGHSPRPPTMSDYTVTRYSDDVELLIRKNTQLFSERMALLLDKVQEAEGVPICVSQPHLFTIDTDGQLKGVSKVMEHEGKSYSGLDYDASIKSLNKEMKRICTLKGGIYVDMATKKFAPGDFYDSVHTTPAGAKRLGEYFFDEFNP